MKTVLTLAAAALALGATTAWTQEPKQREPQAKPEARQQHRGGQQHPQGMRGGCHGESYRGTGAQHEHS